MLAALAAAPAHNPNVALPQPRHKLNDLLKQAAAYVRHFENDFSAIVTDETYEQEDWRGSASLQKLQQRRHIRSEMLFMRLPGEGLTWVSARNVLEVDGHPIEDSHDRLERVITGDAQGLAQRLLSVAEEGARFNIGRVQRNFNDPILPLLFLDPTYQPRFKFRLEEKDETIDGVRAIKMSFKETERPTVIREVGGKSIPTSGAVWIRADDAVVVRTEVAADERGIRFQIRVDYRHDNKLDTWIPARMEEHYGYSTSERIDCVAEYSNARRFETSGRVIVR